MLQIVAIPFVFISVTTAAYFGIPPEKNNQVSGLINFVRNIGGSILISLTNALVTERAQWHQKQLSKNTTLAEQQLPAADRRACGTPSTVRREEPTDCIWPRGSCTTSCRRRRRLWRTWMSTMCCAFAAVLMVPLAFLLDRNQPGGGPVMME